MAIRIINSNDCIFTFFPMADETVFAGLHYRINMATGLKEAKLMDGNNGTEYYRLLKKWLQDHQTGKLTQNNGGFKITKQVKVPKKSISEKSQDNIGFDESRTNPSNSNSLAVLPEIIDTEDKLKQAKSDLNKIGETDSKLFFDDLKKLDDLHFTNLNSEKIQDIVSLMKWMLIK